MSITQTITDSFKQEILQGVHDFNNDTFMLALYTSSADLNRETATYDSLGETSGAGYTSGGVALTGGVVTLEGKKGLVDFNDATWSLATFTTRGGLIYNSSKANRSVAVLDFGMDRTTSGADAIIRFPDANASDAIIRTSG